MRLGLFLMTLVLYSVLGCSDDAVTSYGTPGSMGTDMGTTNNGSGRRLTIICSADMASGTCSALSADVYALTGDRTPGCI